MKTLEQRVKRLEKETVWYRRATIVLGLLIIAGVTMGQTSSGIVDVLKCRKLKVYNASGKVTTWCGSDKMGGIIVNRDQFQNITIDISNKKHGGNLKCYYTHKQTEEDKELAKQGLVRLAAAELTGILGNDSKGGFLAIRDKKGNDISTMRSY